MSTASRLCSILYALVFCCGFVENLVQPATSFPQCHSDSCICINKEDSLQILCHIEGFGHDEQEQQQQLQINYKSHPQGSLSKASLEISCPCNLDLVNNSVYDTLNGISFNDVSIINLDHCPLPSNTFSNLFGMWTNISVTQLSYQSCRPVVTLPPTMLDELKELTDMHLQSNGFETLLEDTFRHTVNLKQLMLNNNNLIRIPNGIFRNLNRLVLLQLGTNKIEEIDEDVFSDSSNLIQLNLETNPLGRIPNNLFKPLKNLSILDLSKCQILRLDSRLFEHNIKLTELGLRDNSFTELPAGMFNHNPKLTKIELQGNRNLSTIGENVFSSLQLLKELDLRNCRLNHLSLQNQDWLHLKQLKVLRLAGNLLEKVDANWFAALSNLETLDLSRNQLTSLSANLFLGLSKLSTLTLQHNQLVHLEEGVFRGMGRLKNLLLQNNSLERIGVKVLSPLHNLKMINLAHNNLSFEGGVGSEYFYAQSPLQMNLQLESVDLSHNRITEILHDWHNMNNLSRLNLRNNSVGSLAFSDLRFSPIVNIELDLRDNRIEKVSEFHLASKWDSLDNHDGPRFTKILYLDQNPLFCDCEVYFLAKYMNRTLQLLDYWTIKAPQLTCHGPAQLANIRPTQVDPSQFVCACNQEDLKSCTCHERPYDNTLLIDCQAMNLTVVPNPLPTKTDYKSHLNLSNNQIDMQMNGSLKQISSLDLSRNGLTDNDLKQPWWHQLKVHFPDLTQLNLRHNNLTSVPDQIIQMWNETRDLKLVLSGNPWRCSCSERPLLNFLITSWNRIEDYNEILCDSGDRLTTLTLETMCSNITMTLRVTAITMPILALVILVISAFVYRYRRTLRAWMYTRRIFLACVTKDEDDEDDGDRIYDAFVSFSHQDEQFVVEQLVMI